MNPTSVLLYFGVVCAATGAGTLLVAALWSGDRRIGQRLSRLLGGQTLRHDVSANGKKSITRQLSQLSPLKAAATLESGIEEKRSRDQARLLHAGVYSPAALVVMPIARAVLAVVPFFASLAAARIGGINYQLAVSWGAIAGCFGMILPGLWLDHRKARRHAVLNSSLPDALDLLVTCVEGGLSLEAALQRVTDELRIAHPMLAGEMGVVQKQIEFGTPPDVAFGNFAERTDLESLYALGILLQQGRRFGTSIVETLRAQAEGMRTDREQRAEELAQKAAVKILLPTLLLIFPAIFVILAGPAAIQLSEAFASK